MHNRLYIKPFRRNKAGCIADTVNNKGIDKNTTAVQKMSFTFEPNNLCLAVINSEYHLPFLRKGGEMGERMRNFDWQNTAVGTPDTWPQSLRTAVGIVLHSKFPMFLFWGPELICFYNDAYRPSLGDNGKHPAALGKPGQEVWQEIWPIIKPVIDKVALEVEASWSEDQLIPIYRNGNVENVYWTFSYSPVHDEAGDITGIFVTCVETTKQVESIQKFKLSDERFQNLVREATVGIIVLTGPEVRVQIVNDAYGRLINRKTKELLGQNLFTIIPETEAHFRPIIDKIRITGEQLHLYDHPYFVMVAGEKKDGYLNLVYQPYKEKDGTITGVMVLCQDVTEQVLTRKKIEEAEERARLSIEAAELGTYEVDIQTREIIASERMNEIFDSPASKLQDDYLCLIHKDDCAVRQKAYEEAVVTGNLMYEARIRRRNGEIHWIKLQGKITFENNLPVKVIGVVKDITEEKELMRQKDEFISIVSHELKTPITSLKAYSQLLTRKFEAVADAASASMLTKMNDQVNRLNLVVQDLLDVSRIEGDKLKFRVEGFDFPQLIIQCIEEVQRTTQSHQIIYNAANPAFIEADRERTGQVLINLLTNAVKFSPKANKVIVALSVQNGEVKCIIQDFGVGISKEKQSRIFERFYQASEDHRINPGLGLGLYISAEIMKRQNGKIWLESELQKGAAFYISFLLT